MSGESEDHATRFVDTREPQPLKERFSQWKVLMRKNLILMKRHFITTAVQLLSPIIFLVLLLIIQAAITTSSSGVPHPTPQDISGLPKCFPSSKIGYCVTIIYSPATPDINAVMQTVATANGLTISTTPDDKTKDIWGFPTEAAAVAWSQANPNTTKWGVAFPEVFNLQGYQIYQNITLQQQMEYDIWFNNSIASNFSGGGNSDSGFVYYEVLQMERAMSEALLTFQAKKPVSITLQTKPFPSQPPTTNPYQAANLLGGLFFYCGVMFSFLIQLIQVVGEKEQKLRTGLRMMGLKDSAFWLSWFALNYFLVILASIVLVTFGYIFDFPYFSQANWGVNFVVFMVFGLSMIPFAFFISTFVKTLRGAVIIGILFFFFGVLMYIVLVFTSVIYLLYLESTGPGYKWILFFFPPYHYCRLYADISPATAKVYDFVTDKYIDPTPGYLWGNFSTIPQYPGYSEYSLLDPTVYSIWYLLMDFAIFAVLTWYLDAVIPSELGTPRPWYFPFSPSYWGCAKRAHRVRQLARDQSEGIEDSDVVTERERVMGAGVNAEAAPLQVHELHMTYGGACSSRTVKAVRGLTFAAESGKCFALLGHNGAGKSTAISVMSGLNFPTAGDVMVHGHSVIDDIDKVRRMIGVCPQHDILWNDLTAREHLELFAALRNVPREEVLKLVKEKLTEVKLDQVADKLAGSFSGGMKRRLSVAISSIGDPKIIFMDEPTTGMDPVNRAHVWRMIEKLKEGRVILLTTHSMEEADTLGDRIAIMKAGQLCCIGESLHLKNKFGSGYRLSLIVDVKDVERVRAEVERVVPGSKMVDSSAGALSFEMPTEVDRLADGLEWVEDHAKGDKDSLIRDFGIMQTTLEEVFLRLTGEHAHANAHGGNHPPAGSHAKPTGTEPSSSAGPSEKRMSEKRESRVPEKHTSSSSSSGDSDSKSGSH